MADIHVVFKRDVTEIAQQRRKAVTLMPKSLREATDVLDRSRVARAALGDEVVDFYVHTARLEAQAFNDAVTDWERIRYFERI